MDKIYCDSCGKDLRSKKGVILAGVQWSLEIGENASEDDLAFSKKQWGKYFSPDGVKIYLCMECFIDSAFPKYNPYL